MGLLNMLKLYGLIAANIDLTFVSGIVLNTSYGLDHAVFSVTLSSVVIFILQINTESWRHLVHPVQKLRIL